MHTTPDCRDGRGSLTSRRSAVMALLGLAVVCGPDISRAQNANWTQLSLGTTQDIKVLGHLAYTNDIAVGGTGGFYEQSTNAHTIWPGATNFGTSAEFNSCVNQTSNQTWIGAGNGVVWKPSEVAEGSEVLRGLG